MFVEPADYRPGSVFIGRSVGAAVVLGGFGGMFFMPAFLLVASVLFTVATGRSPLDPTAIAEEPDAVVAPELPVVEAGFVQLGREWDPRELPDRRIASNAQAPRAQDPNVVSPFQRLLSDAGVPPQNRALTSLLDTSASYDQDGNAQLLFEQEGQAWGGDHAQAGDMLVGQIKSLIRRGLNVPTSLAESEYSTTVARVRVTVDSTWTVTSIVFVSGSGNEDWDRAVRQRVDEIAASRPQLHAVPGSEGLLNQPTPVAVVPVAGRRRAGGGAGGSNSLLQQLGGGN